MPSYAIRGNKIAYREKQIHSVQCDHTQRDVMPYRQI